MYGADVPDEPGTAGYQIQTASSRGRPSVANGSGRDESVSAISVRPTIDDPVTAGRVRTWLRMTRLNAAASKTPMSSARRRPPKNRRMRTGKGLDARGRAIAFALELALERVAIDIGPLRGGYAVTPTQVAAAGGPSHVVG
jgi:hypothetical protein